MKKIYAAILVLILSLGAVALADVAIDETNFPDTAFRAYVAENFDIDKNGALSDDEISAVEGIDVRSKPDIAGISSLKGIEYFTNLYSLECGYNSLTSLDVTHNPLLGQLLCNGNRLTSLDLSKNPRLSRLEAQENQHLETLDLSHNTELWFVAVGSNGMSSIDLSSLSKLEVLYAEDNNLTALDVSKNTKLRKIVCWRNPLTSLDVSKNPALTELRCFENANGFKIIATANSYAVNYAQENNIPYEIVGGEAPCAHVNVSHAGFLDVQSYVDNGDGTHTETGILYDTVTCLDCGEVIEQTVKNENHSQVEMHYFPGDSNTCPCGYTADCVHANTHVDDSYIAYDHFVDNNDGETHTMVGSRMHRVVCDDCGKLLVNEVMDDNATEIQPHNYLDGDTCFRCGYVKGGASAPDPAYAGVYELDGAKVLVKDGQVDVDAEGLTRDAAHPDDWYYCSAGVVHTEVTSVVPYDGAWFYVSEGKLDTTFVGIVDYDDGRFLVAAGRIMNEVNGLNQDPNGSDWYFYANGQIQNQYTGLAQYDGAWFYIVEGKLAEDFTGDVEYDGAMFHVDHGMLAA